MEIHRPRCAPQTRSTLAKVGEPIDLKAAIDKITAEHERVENLPPREKILHYRQKIANAIAVAEAGPLPDRPGVVPLQRQIHEIVVKTVKDGFPTEHYIIRGCEIGLLKESGFDTTALEQKHERWRELPWKWVADDEKLSEDARRLIETLLKAGSAVRP